MRTLLLLTALATSTALTGVASAAEIYTLDRATSLAKPPFDFKGEPDAV